MKMIEISEPTTVAECNGLARVMTFAMNTLFERGFGPSDGSSPWYYKDSAVVARDGGNIVGFITYRYEKGEGTAWIMLGWVRDVYRRDGIYRKMWNKVVEALRKDGCKRIAGMTHINNEAMRAVYEKLGRVEKYISSYYNIEEV